MATEPPVISSAVIAWLDAFAAFARMPATFGVATLATFVLRVVTEPLVSIPPAFEFRLLLLVLLFASGLVSALLLTPAAIAVHRYVLLGEITGRYRLSPTNPRFQRFFLFTVVFQFLLGAPIVSLAGVMYWFQGFASFVFGLIVFVLSIGAVIVALRTLILFPAIAVDAPGTEWRNALSDTKGHSWRVFFIVVCVAVPAVVVEWLVRRWTGQSAAGSTILMFVKSVESIVMIAAYAAAASRIYWAFTERLGRPPEIASSPV